MSKYRAFHVLAIALLLSACASIKRIIPIEELKPEDIEPRVSFVDNEKSIEIKTSNIQSIDAEKVIASYERLLNRGNPQIRQEAIHRLANLTMRLAEAKAALIDAEQTEKITPAMHQSSFTKAISLYQTLIDEFPQSINVDEATYQLARAYSLNAEPESSLALLDKIAVKHPESVSYIESQFRRGESYFVRKDYQTAELAYKEVIDKGINTEFYEKALYKRGWSLFKQSLFLEAQNDFFVLYERLLHQKEIGEKTTRLTDDLLTDTRRVISLGFYNLEGAETVQAYFKTQGGKDYEHDIYEALAKLFISQERFQNAAETYMAFIDGHPLSLNAPEFHSRVIDIYRQGGFPSLILPAKEKFVTNYGKQSQFWKTYDGKVLDDLKPLLKQHLVDISKFYHAKAQSSKNPNDYLVAAKWYKEILNTFDDPSVDSKYRFLLAETLNDGGQLPEAAIEYEVVAYHNKLSEFSRDAGYRALVIYQQIQHPKTATNLQKLTPSINSGKKFIKAFPSDKQASEILARIAEQQLMVDDIKGAIESSKQLLVLPAKRTSSQNDRAKIIIANGLFDLKQYEQAEIAITDLLATVSLNKKQRKNFETRRVEAVFQMAEQAKSEQKLDQAIALYLKVRKIAPKSKIAVNALFDAATLQLQKERWQEAGELFESFRKSYPKHPLAKTIPEKLALIYESKSDWNNAAEEYLVLAKNFTEPNQQREAYWRVAELYLKAKNYSKAIVQFKYYAWTYPEPYLLAQEARNHLVELYIETGDQLKSQFWRQKIVAFYDDNAAKNNSRTRSLAAKHQLYLSELLFNQFKKIKLTLPLANSLKKKRSAMKKALAAYNKIANYEIAEYVTASTHKVAEIYHNLSKDLMSSQRPKGLDEEELEEYGYLLEDQAIPFEDKAIEYYQINAQRTQQKIYDNSVKLSIKALAELKPAHYAKQEKLVGVNDVEF